MSDDSGWSLTESDPQVFSELLRQLGVKGLQVDDLYSLDEYTLAELQPIHALIFLFKYVGNDDGKTDGEAEDARDGVYFANQIINNSCGTLAALNAVMNIPQIPSEYPGESIELGPELTNLKEFGAGMGSVDLGHLIAQHPLLRETHNSFSKSTPFALDPSAADQREKEDAYHFVTYVPIHGALYELDGLRKTPVKHGLVPEGDAWVERAREVIESRIATYPAGSVMFNLLCIRSDPIPRLKRQAEMSEESAIQLSHELEKRRKGDLENALRRHNLLPAVFAVLKGLGETGALPSLVEAARKKGEERRAARVKRGEDD